MPRIGYSIAATRRDLQSRIDTAETTLTHLHSKLTSLQLLLRNRQQCAAIHQSNISALSRCINLWMLRKEQLVDNLIIEKQKQLMAIVTALSQARYYQVEVIARVEHINYFHEQFAR
jgi:hypothetical protein